MHTSVYTGLFLSCKRKEAMIKAKRASRLAQATYGMYQAPSDEKLPMLVISLLVS
jgi:hypothetical protein